MFAWCTRSTEARIWRNSLHWMEGECVLSSIRIVGKQNAFICSNYLLLLIFHSCFPISTLLPLKHAPVSSIPSFSDDNNSRHMNRCRSTKGHNFRFLSSFSFFYLVSAFIHFTFNWNCVSIWIRTLYLLHYTIAHSTTTSTIRLAFSLELHRNAPAIRQHETNVQQHFTVIVTIIIFRTDWVQLVWPRCDDDDDVVDGGWRTTETIPCGSIADSVCSIFAVACRLLCQPYRVHEVLMRCWYNKSKQKKRKNAVTTNAPDVNRKIIIYKAPGHGHSTHSQRSAASEQA